MLARNLVWSLLGAVACSSVRPATPDEGGPALVVPVPIAEGHGDGVPAELPAASASAAPGSVSSAARAAAPRPFSDDQPDPTPLRQADQYAYTFRYENGTIRLAGVRPVRYAQPIVTARRMGRFAVELWIGHELVDRVRFDFPLLADAEPDQRARPLYERPTKMAGPFDAVVVVPNARRARTARLVDRATRRESELSWPPAPNGLGPLMPLPNSSVTAAAPNAPATNTAGPVSSAPAPVPTHQP